MSATLHQPRITADEQAAIIAETLRRRLVADPRLIAPEAPVWTALDTLRADGGWMTAHELAVAVGRRLSLRHGFDARYRAVEALTTLVHSCGAVVERREGRLRAARFVRIAARVPVILDAYEAAETDDATDAPAPTRTSSVPRRGEQLALEVPA